MQEITVETFRELPRICAITGAPEACLSRTDEIPLVPPILHKLWWVPFGYFALMGFQQWGSKRSISITYHLSEAGNAILKRRRAGLLAMMLALFLCLFTILLWKSIVAGILAILLMQIGPWLEKEYRWPFVVRSYTENSVTFQRVPDNLAAAYRESLPVLVPGVQPKIRRLVAVK